VSLQLSFSNFLSLILHSWDSLVANPVLSLNTFYLVTKEIQIPLPNKSLSKELPPKNYFGPTFPMHNIKLIPAPSTNLRSDISGITESQNHRIVGVGRDLCGSSSPTPLPKQGQQSSEKLQIINETCRSYQRISLSLVTSSSWPPPPICS